LTNDEVTLMFKALQGAPHGAPFDFDHPRNDQPE
jgi:hypothetical protein